MALQESRYVEETDCLGDRQTGTLVPYAKEAPERTAGRYERWEGPYWEAAGGGILGS